MTRYAIERNHELVKHFVFEASNDNYPDSTITVLAFESLKNAEELLKIWPDAQVFDLKNNLHVVSESGIV